MYRGMMQVRRWCGKRHAFSIIADLQAEAALLDFEFRQLVLADELEEKGYEFVREEVAAANGGS